MNYKLFELIDSYIWLLILLIIIRFLIPIVRTIRIKSRIKKLANSALNVTPNEFLK